MGGKYQHTQQLLEEIKRMLTGGMSQREAEKQLGYSFVGRVLYRFNTVSQEQQANLPPTLFVLAGNDPISDGSL